MHKLFPHVSKFRNPIYLVALVVLVGILASLFPSLGTDGMTYAVIGAIALLIAVPIGLGLLKSAWYNMLHGKPSKLDFAAAPAGYRRARRTETQEEAAAQSVVSPTPHRPLVVDADPGRAVVPAVPAQVQKFTNKQFHDPLLDLAAECQPPVGMVLGRGIIFLGMRGSGKTTGLARFLEQLCKFPIPALIFDQEEGFLSLQAMLGERCVIAGSKEWDGRHRCSKYWGVTTTNAFNVGYAILETGAQVILQTGTYETLDEAAEIMTKMIRGMFKWAEQQPPEKRVPALVCLDEAQLFMPQNAGMSSISSEQANALIRAFADVNSRGRKRGLTPVIATQRPAQTRKEAITGSEIYFLMKQTYPIDLKFYEELVSNAALAAAGITRQQIAAFESGDALLFEGGEVSLMRFKERQSKHTGITPGLGAAKSRYDGKAFDYSSGLVEHLEETGKEDEAEVDTEELEAMEDQEREPLPEVTKRDQRRKAEEIDLKMAVTLWNGGFASRAKLAKALDIAENQASKLMVLMGVSGSDGRTDG